MFDDRSPIYQQIADKIKDEILSGSLPEEEQVMSTNQYAAFYRINPATAAKAFHLLVDEGILYKRRGIGMFVSAGARDTLRQSRRDRFFEDVLEPMVTEAERIGISIDEIIQRLAKKKGGEEE